jgi:hypothetical protein
MARCPFATWVPVTLRASQKKIKPAGLVCHTAVSNSALLKPSGEVRWHFYLDRDGHLYQFFDTTVSAACQRDGNYWTSGGEGRGFLSCESWDGAYTSVWPNPNKTDTIPPWTDKQMATWGRLGAWLHDTHGIPLIKATGVRGQGIGYHSQFTAPDGTLRWNKSHACPAKARIAQMPTVIRMMNDALEGDVPLTAAEKKEIAQLAGAEAAKQVWAYKLDPGPYAERIGGYKPGQTYPAGGLLVGADTGSREDRAARAAEIARDQLQQATLNGIRAAVAELDTGLSDEQLEQLARRSSELTTIELIGEVAEDQP